MEKTHIETIIVGAGPAGTTCGYVLKKNNHDCLIIDRKDFPRDKLCGGGLTPKAHILVDKIFEGIKYDYYSVNTIDMFSQKKYICSYTLDTELRTVTRREFDNVLLREYEKSGGRKITDTVVKIEENEDKIHVTLLSGKKLSCNFLIGADGANSIVRRYLQPEFKKGIVCLEKTVEDISIRNMQVYFDKKFKNGYLYVFPNTNGYVVGYGDKRTNLQTFDKSLKEHNLMSENKTKGAYIPMFDNIDYPFRKDIILIGDAGGYADSMTGEGIYFAVKSGQNAALSIVHSQNFKLLNEDVINVIRKRKKMSELFFFAPVHGLFVYLCKKPKWLIRINRKVNQALSI
ncbi:geranylgeranyl reductase family protein [Dysgonomonas sp. Marseille-P4677]|uniref:geranylgeranyl reductase family protein n=1 Tax=Dysgonomonas sp. Marseille-P4677 TaxID=2364790 RepID=UPI001912810C|nr:geranylgeranyl reductase family protein [Dysgonomonas sp. Marseille-P4677]MBK5720077.1 geranylgeranyl reductase family protein [Dysgonomonas sp. Marseille-P4677]